MLAAVSFSAQGALGYDSNVTSLPHVRRNLQTLPAAKMWNRVHGAAPHNLNGWTNITLAARTARTNLVHVMRPPEASDATRCAGLVQVELQRWGFGNVMRFVGASLEMLRVFNLCPVLIDSSGLDLLEHFELRNGARKGRPEELHSPWLPTTLTLTEFMTWPAAQLLVTLGTSAPSVWAMRMQPSFSYHALRGRASLGASSHFLRSSSAIGAESRAKGKGVCASLYMRTCNPKYLEFADTCRILSRGKDRVIEEPLQALRELQLAVNCSGRPIFLSSDSLRLRREAIAASDLDVRTFMPDSIAHPQKSENTTQLMTTIMRDWFAIAFGDGELAGSQSTFFNTAICYGVGHWRSSDGASVLHYTSGLSHIWVGGSREGLGKMCMAMIAGSEDVSAHQIFFSTLEAFGPLLVTLAVVAVLVGLLRGGLQTRHGFSRLPRTAVVGGGE